MLNIPSPLSDEIEKLMHDTIGCCIAVHRTLGPGLAEKIYLRALGLELSAAGISFEREKRFDIVYRGQVMGVVRVDLIVGGQVVVEVKSIEQLLSVHHKQILNYMRVARLRAGLLLNFNVGILPDGMHRKVR
jgi:GxxExxY protein